MARVVNDKTAPKPGDEALRPLGARSVLSTMSLRQRFVLIVSLAVVALVTAVLGLVQLRTESQTARESTAIEQCDAAVDALVRKSKEGSFATDVGAPASRARLRAYASSVAAPLVGIATGYCNADGEVLAYDAEPADEDPPKPPRPVGPPNGPPIFDGPPGPPFDPGDEHPGDHPGDRSEHPPPRVPIPGLFPTGPELDDRRPVPNFSRALGDHLPKPDLDMIYSCTEAPAHSRHARRNGARANGVYAFRSRPFARRTTRLRDTALALVFRLARILDGPSSRSFGIADHDCQSAAEGFDGGGQQPMMTQSKRTPNRARFLFRIGASSIVGTATAAIVATLSGCLTSTASGTSASTATCSTNQTSSVDKGVEMSPGGDCISCHDSGGGPRYSVAGTVMGAYDDEDQCVGVQNLIVEITDANGTVTKMTTNAAGNFFATGSIVMPYTAKVSDGTNEVAMASSQTDADCASCHTQTGANNAPGRIIGP